MVENRLLKKKNVQKKRTHKTNLKNFFMKKKKNYFKNDDDGKAFKSFLI